VTSNHFSELRRSVLEEKTHLIDKGGVGKLNNQKGMSIHSSKLGHGV